MSFNEFALEANRRGFIGLQVFPALGVAQTDGTFAKLDLENQLPKVENTVRLPRGTYKRDDFVWTTDTFKLDEHGVEEVVDDLSIEMYGDILRAEAIATKRAVHRVLQRLEYDIAAVINGSWTYTTGVVNKWNGASSDCIADVDAAKALVRNRIGLPANAIIITETALLGAARSDRVEGLLKYSGGDDPKALVESMARVWDLDKVIVAKSVKNTADRGQAASLSGIWTTGYAMVCRIVDDGMSGAIDDPNPCIGRTLFLNESGASVPGMDDGESSLIVEEYREEQRRGGVIRARNKRQVKTLYVDAGQQLTNVYA